MELAELERAKTAMIRPWLIRARDLVARRFADARAHAITGSLAVASSRLQDLARDLAGTMDEPEDGLVGQARGAFYQTSFTLQRLRLDPEIHDLDLGPEPDDILFAQRFPIGGTSFHTAINDLVDNGAAPALALAINAAGSPDTSPELKAAVFGAWEREQSQRVLSRVDRELKTTSIALYEAVGRVMLRPEHR